MSVTTCPRCGKAVSDKTPICHNCGHSLKKTKNTSRDDNEGLTGKPLKIGCFILLVLVILIVVIIL